MKVKKESLLFKFAIIFICFTVLALFWSSLSSYINQTSVLRKEGIKNIKNVGSYLEELIQDNPNDFALYQDYYMSHYAEMNIPYDFTSYEDSYNEFKSLFQKYYSGKVIGRDIKIQDTNDEVQMAYFTCMHKFWVLTFEKASKTFNLPYVYYLVPKEEIFHVVYMIDGERTPRKDNLKLLYLGDEYFNDRKECKVEWDTWFSGRKLNEYQVWNNEWGHTYTYYTPLILNGRKLGLIGTELEVNSLNKEILRNTLHHSLGMGIALIVCIFLLLLFIHKNFISRLLHLSFLVKLYTDEKDVLIAKRIFEDTKGKDEISVLSRTFSTMITELDAYIHSLSSKEEELSCAKKLADEMTVLSQKDSLTGVRNKTAYDKEVERLNKCISSCDKKFGIAMIDLNFLKKINDTYGHEKGDEAIKNLCKTICNIFEHSPVFRVGGDEFIVILENDDYYNADSLIKKFHKECEKNKKNGNLEEWEKVSAAIGISKYNSSKDDSVQSVFSRADEMMYKNKKAMKGECE